MSGSIDGLRVSPSVWLEEQVPRISKAHRQKLDSGNCPALMKSSMHNAYMTGVSDTIALLRIEELTSIPTEEESAIIK